MWVCLWREKSQLLHDRTTISRQPFSTPFFYPTSKSLSAFVNRDSWWGVGQYSRVYQEIVKIVNGGSSTLFTIFCWKISFKRAGAVAAHWLHKTAPSCQRHIHRQTVVGMTDECNATSCAHSWFTNCQLWVSSSPEPKPSHSSYNVIPTTTGQAVVQVARWSGFVY